MERARGVAIPLAGALVAVLLVLATRDLDHVGRVDLVPEKGPAPGYDPLVEVNKLVALARYPNVWVKVSELSSLSASKKYPFRDTYPIVKKVYDAFGPDRLLWGTGFPGATRAEAKRPTLEQELAIIQKEIPFFTAEDRRWVLGGTALKLWPFAGS